MCVISCCGLRVAFFLALFLKVNIVNGQINEELVQELYKAYTDAVSSEPSSSLRRLFKNNKEYNIHVERLKEVNGYKKHNLLIKEVQRSGSNPIIYINNPVEFKIPNAYLSLDEFKRLLTDRVEKDKEKFNNTKKTKFTQIATIKNSRNITVVAKKGKKPVMETSITNKMSVLKNYNNHKTLSDKIKIFSTFATTKLNIDHKMHNSDKTSVIKPNTSKKPYLTNKTKYSTSQISTLKTNANNTNSVYHSTVIPQVNITLENILTSNTSTFNAVSKDSTITDKSVVSESNSKEHKEELKLKDNKGENTQPNTTSVDVSGHDTSISYTSGLILNKNLQNNTSSDMTTRELAAKEEIKPENPTIRRLTTKPTTTRSRWRTLGRPRVFLGR